MRVTFAMAFAAAALAGCGSVDKGGNGPATWSVKYNVSYDVLTNCIADRYGGEMGVTPHRVPTERRAVISLTELADNKAVAEFDVRQTDDASSTVTYRRFDGASNPDDRQARIRADACASGDYLSVVFRHIDPYRVYPAAARAAGQQGRVVTRVTINRAGGLVDIKIDSSSGWPLIDAAEMEAIRRAMPLPPAPAGMRGDRIVLLLPMNY